MTNKSTIDPEVQKIIQTAIEQTVKKATEAIMAANEIVDAEARNYFRETERLLYSLPALKLSLAEYDEDIKAGELIIGRPKSKDIVRWSSVAGSMPIGLDDMEKIRLASVERTRKQILRIERALDTVKEDLYYEIIPMKYWDGVCGEDIAEKMGCDVTTMRRNKNRLVRSMMLVLFGADAL